MEKQTFTRKEVRTLLDQLAWKLLCEYTDETVNRKRVDQEVGTYFPMEKDVEIKYRGYFLGQLQALIREANEVREADIKNARLKRTKNFTPSPNKAEDKLRELEILDDEGCFMDWEYLSEYYFEDYTKEELDILKKLDEWYTNEYC